MTIDPTKIHIPTNYVLVLPDPYHDEYNCGILTSSYKLDEQGQSHSTKLEHVSVTGTVYAVCGSLDFRGHEIWHLQDNSSMRRGTLVRVPEAQRRIDEHRRYSVGYEVDVECEVGDKALFDYFSYQLADQQGLWFDTEFGAMMLVKYDMFILADRNGEIIPLNGNVIIENEKIEKQEIEAGVQGLVRDSGIVLIQDKEEKRNRTSAEAVVVAKAGLCKAYLENRDRGDTSGFFELEGGWSWREGDIEPGTKILYDPRFAKEVEYGLHRVFSDRRLLRIQRKDIYCVLKEKRDEVLYI